MNSDQIVCVGCDDGFAQTKVVWKKDDGTVGSLIFPSRIAMGNKATRTDGGPSPLVYQTNSNYFTVTPPSDWVDTRFAGYPTSELNRVLVHHGLYKAGLAGRKVKLVTGLPPGTYYSGPSGRNDQLIVQKAGSMKKPVRPEMNKGLPPEIVDSTVSSEGLAVALDQIFDDDGFERQEVDGMWSIVDIGGRTSDVVSIWKDEDHLSVDPTRTQSMDRGVMSVLDEVRAKIIHRLGIEDRECPPLDDVLRTGQIRVGGDVEDVRALVDEAARRVASEIIQFVRSKIGFGHGMNRVLFAGGGALVFKDAIQDFKGARVVPEPEFANARGMMKLALASMPAKA